MWEKAIRAARTAERQFGCITIAQAIEAGYPRSTVRALVDTGRWIRLHRGVFAIAGSPAPANRNIFAAWLSCGAPSAVAGWSAAALWRFSEIPESMPGVVVPASRRLRRRDVIVTRTRRWDRREIVWLGNVRVTSPMRTLLDVAPESPPLTREILIDEAHRRALVDLRRFSTYLCTASAKRIPAAADLRDLVAERDPERAPDSAGETKLLRRLRRAGIPRPVLGFWVMTSSGPRRIDGAYPAQKVGLEFDGFRWHDGRTKFDDDRARQNDLRELGWDLRHVTSSMLDDPAPKLETMVATALGLHPTQWSRP